jgi:hypothetical protein
VPATNEAQYSHRKRAVVLKVGGLRK